MQKVHTQELVVVRETVGAESTHTQEMVLEREAVGAESTHTGVGCSEGGSGCREYTHTGNGCSEGGSEGSVFSERMQVTVRVCALEAGEKGTVRLKSFDFKLF